MGDEPPIIRPHAKIRIVNVATGDGADDVEELRPLQNFETNGYVHPRPRSRKNKRYNDALKTLLPYRSIPKEGRQLPMEQAGFFSYLAVGWNMKTMLKAVRTGLSPLDLYTLGPRDQAKNNAERLQRIWEDEQAEASKANPPREPSLAKCIFRFAKTRILVSSLLIIAAITLQFLGPSIVLKLLLDHINDPTSPEYWGWFLVAILFIVQLMRNVFFNLMFNVGIHTSIRVLGATQYLGFSKLLRLSSPNESALGQFITYCTGDQERIHEALVAGVLILGTPLMFIMSIVYAWILVGPISLLGSLVIFLFYPIMGGVATLTSRLRLNVVCITDKRVTMMNEILNSIRLIKMYAWEEPFHRRVHDLRTQERKELQKAAFITAFAGAIQPSVTIIAAVVTFIALTNADIVLYAPTAFTLFSIFASLQFTIGTLPYTLRCLAEARIGIRRLQNFLDLPEYVHPTERLMNGHRGGGDEKAGLALFIKEADLAWEGVPEIVNVSKESRGKAQAKREKSKAKKDKANGTAKPETEDEALISNTVTCLSKIDLTVKKGELLGIAGSVGSGKSSLVSAIMGEMTLTSGELRLNGRPALVTQQAWIFNGTIRENILFGAAYKRDRYRMVLEACALEPDLKMLPNGDMTEIGERGVNLSGGQKQRVNLARALFADADIYLLDDPLSAVDAKVAQQIFQKYIQEALKDKTVLLVSHAMQFLGQCDKVAFMRNGQIVEVGSHQELLEHDGEYVNMLSFDQTRDKSDGKAAESPKKKDLPNGYIPEEEQALQKFTNDEEMDQLYTGWNVLLKYFKASGGYFIIFLVFFFIVLFALSRLFTSVWLQIWIDQGDGLEEERKRNLTEAANATEFSDLNMTVSHDIKGPINHNPDLWMYQLVYGMSLLLMMFLGMIKGVSVAFSLLRGSSRLHDRMLTRILGSPVVFFDKTPTGRILNRFSKDMDELDVRMPFLTEFTFQSMLFCFTQILIVCFLYPWFTLPFLAIITIFIVMDMGMNRGVLETRKLENLMKSPVLHNISSAMAGIPIIRGFQRHGVFQKRFNESVNNHLSSDLVYRMSARWFQFWMDLVALFAILITALFAILARDTVSSAVAGLALTSVFQTCTFIPFVMRIKSEYRARFTSVERVAEYANDIPQEEDPTTEKTHAPKDWPSKGEIEMWNVCLRYREELPMVLRGISAEIKPSEKVGIVGRTGAGKSSLITTLLRLTELEAGRISIDGIDISKLSLKDLRSAIAVIPQDPVLFCGTIRYNLDPFNTFSDEKIWEALEKAKLKEKISAENQQLEMAVESEGDNFSLGEKQLICLARALLRGNRILLLDEATASVDVKTDYLIQETIREAFADCTVLTIAHRLHTVLNYDRVLVLDKGEVVEFDSPEDLMNRPEGVFASMMKAVQSN